MKNLVKKNQLMITALAIMIAIAGYLQFAGTNLEEEYLTVEDGFGDAKEVDSTGIVTEHYIAGELTGDDLANRQDLSWDDMLDAPMDEEAEGLFDLSEEELLTAGVLDIESLDIETDIDMQDYLEEGMEVAQATPEAGEIPGEAVFTGSAGVAMLADAKLLKEQVRAKNKETLLQIINSDGITDGQKQEAVDTMVEMTAIAEKEAAAEILLEAKGFTDVVVSIADGAVDVVVNAPELSEAQRAQIEDIVKRKTEISADRIIISTVVAR